MSKTAERFASNKAAGRKTLVGYFPIGYPTLNESVDAAIAMCKNGVDILELGVPYSDPVMDGLVIQQATGEALANGFKLAQVFEAVKAVTEAVDTPVLVMTYWNPVIQFGVEDFAQALQQAGGAGLITPDLIPDEANDWLKVSDELSLDRVFLATPTSSPARMHRACELSRGFVYSVSTMGITGTRDSVDDLAQQVVTAVRATGTNQNTAVGIGISTAEQVLDVNKYADGAIVGSAFVRAYQDGGLAQLIEKVKELDPNH
ncbi:MAG: hypothetical protein RL101_145 [Actinomycetota bacterium]|jgi:tryptophan synthase alpha chain